MIHSFWRTVWQFIYKVKHTFIPQLRKITSMYLPKGNENMLFFFFKDVRKNIHSSFISNSPKLETTKMSSNSQIDRETVIYLCHGISLNHKKRLYVLIHVIKWINPKIIMLRKRSQTQKCTYCGFHSHEVLKQTMLTYGDRNWNGGCLCEWGELDRIAGNFQG